MHAPDGFLTAGTAITTGAVSAGGLGLALRRTRDQLADRTIPLAGLTAAFVFAGQMVNFPIGGGVSGHLIGGALAAVLLGPWLGALAVAVVVVVQALVFADGGLTALGYNLLNMAFVPAFAGWGVFRVVRRLVPPRAASVSIAAGVAGFVSVLASAMAFSLEWLFGASAPVPFDRVAGAMLGVHTLIGIGEAVITAFVVAAVMATRPDLVAGADGIDVAPRGPADRRRTRRFQWAAAGVTLLVAVGVSQLAVDDPDGLESVAAEQGFGEAGTEHALGSSLFADYATQGVANDRVSLAVAGLFGVVLTLAVGSGILLAVRRPGGSSAGDRNDPGPPAPTDDRPVAAGRDGG